MRPDSEPDPDLAAELRGTAGREWLEEAAEDERLTELMRRRRMTLHEVMAEAGNRGDRVSVEFGGHTFSGSIAGVAQDFATISGVGQTADVKLAVGVWSVLVSGEPAQRGTGIEAETFVALLKTYEAERATLRFALGGGSVAVGRIVVVAGDHIEMADPDDRRLYLPLESILATIRSTEFH